MLPDNSSFQGVDLSTRTVPGDSRGLAHSPELYRKHENRSLAHTHTQGAPTGSSAHPPINGPVRVHRNGRLFIDSALSTPYGLASYFSWGHVFRYLFGVLHRLYACFCEVY